MVSAFSLFCFSVIFLISIFSLQADAATSIHFQKCNITNFIYEPSCYLKCHLEVDKGVVYQYYSAKINYYTVNKDDNVLLRENTWSSVYLPLVKYNAGYYQCQIIIRNVTTGNLSPTYEESFKVDPNLNGVKLGDGCRADEDCMTLNASCVDGKCQCWGLNYIKFSRHSDTAACLTNAEMMNGFCVIDEQCQSEDSSYTCREGQCLKSNHKRMSPAEIAGTTLSSVAVTLLLLIAILLGMKK